MDKINSKLRLNKNLLITLLSSVALLIIILLTLSNILLFKSAKKYYKSFKLITVDPAQTEKYREANLRLPHKESLRVIMFGDSRIKHWGKPPAIFSENELINRGVAGETTAQARLRFEADVLSLDPDIVILQLGINDLTTIGIAPELSDEITEKCIENLTFIVNTLQEKNIKTVLLTVIPPAKPDILRQAFWNQNINRSVEKINQYILELTPSANLLILDTEKALIVNKDNWQPQVNSDTLHLTDTGYDYLNQTLESILINSGDS